MNKTLITILVLAVVVVGAYFLLSSPEATAPTENNTLVESGEPATQGMPVPGEEGVQEMEVVHVVAYSSAGFSPSELRIKKGETVTWQNNTSADMWVSSAMHPTHMLYSGTSLAAHCPDPSNTSFDACVGVAPGGSWSFTFSKAGTWPYHDHLHASFFGKVIVE